MSTAIPDKIPDVTAVVLNWARLENVKTIVAHLCSEQLRDTISHVIIWNNSPIKLSLVVSLKNKFVLCYVPIVANQFQRLNNKPRTSDWRILLRVC